MRKAAGLAHPLTDERPRDYLPATTSLGGSRINVDRYRRLTGVTVHDKWIMKMCGGGRVRHHAAELPRHHLATMR